MTARLTIRQAVPQDADAMSRVMIASISQLCHADHQGDPDAIAKWTANKTPEEVRGWIGGDHGLYLALLDREPAAVGGVSSRGEITLLYVSPDHQHKGVSSALLAYLEKMLDDAGHGEIRLEATKTALAFYEARGWERSGSETACGSVACLSMHKSLS